jgi:flagellar hook-length control protein FliK
MTQTDYASISLLQSSMVQTQQTTTANEGNGKDSDFQTLLKDKYQTTADSNTSAQAGNAVKEKFPTAKQSNKQEDDPLTQEWACAQFLAMDAQVFTPQIQMPEQQTVEPEVLATDALTTVDPVGEALNTAAAVQQEQQPVQLEQPNTEVVKDDAAPTVDTADTAVSTVETVPVDTAPAQAKTDTQQESSDLPTDKEDDSRFEVTDAAAGAAQPVFRDVEPIMIKVGEAPAAEDTQQTSDVEQQLVQPLTDALAKGESKVEVKLTPESLGTVTLEVTQQKDGALHVVLNADNSHTRALLQEHAENLQNLLGNQNQKNVQVEVSRQENAQQHAADYNSKNGHGQQGGYQQEQQKHHTQSDEDFLQQLRLGLIPLDGEGN